MPRYCLALDLRDDPTGIAEYRRYHETIWPEVRESLVDSGVLEMEIYLVGTRMFMIMETGDGFSFARKAALDAANPKVQEWEVLMSSFQQTLPGAKAGEKWLLMEKVFSLAEQ